MRSRYSDRGSGVTAMFVKNWIKADGFLKHQTSAIRLDYQERDREEKRRTRWLLLIHHSLRSQGAQCDLHVSSVSLLNVHKENRSINRLKRRLRRRPTDARGRRRKTSCLERCCRRRRRSLESSLIS
ncbi:hypothetical protein JOB18_019185 [Solea senegalensis]|uniref:Uncharacterized protein n=1 Tax=Solea senegalensis TaxID=28829 RepID=A0AAV6QEQ1_SOLSE|nr:hypothetical protein JOB18_019185 [Solea senegalensis]